MIPNIAKPTSATDEIATSNARRRKNESGIIGSDCVPSQTTKPTSSTAAATRKPIGLPRCPAVGVRTDQRPDE